MIDREDNTSPLLNLLIAYPYVYRSTLDVIVNHQSSIRWLLDSGAFTAWKAGKSIKLDDYCRFIESLPVQPWRYFMLDVVGDPQATMRNYEAMLKRGFSPIPIFTRGEHPSVLEDYYKTSDVVGIGGLVGTRDNKGFVNGIMSHVRDRRVHWLGFAQENFLRHYRPYSCDSSTWCAGERFAEIPLYFGGYKCERIHKKHFNRKPSKRIASEIASFGFNPMAFARSATWDGLDSPAKILTAQSTIRHQSAIQKMIKTLFFMAILFASQLNRVIASFYREKELSYGKSVSSAIRRAGFNDLPVLGKAAV